jgi:hypothetical protein
LIVSMNHQAMRRHRLLLEERVCGNLCSSTVRFLERTLVTSCFGSCIWKFHLFLNLTLRTLLPRFNLHQTMLIFARVHSTAQCLWSLSWPAMGRP